jgi:leucyl aminopeptidase
MGGSAAVVGLAMYMDQMNLKRPYDFYLAIAENSVDGESFRPGDVYKAKNGMTVEISNTDAEGRLVLADVLDVAVHQSEKPLCVIDLATLTGAIKVALGAEIAGLFSNNDDLSEMLVESSKAYGDLVWRMPLVSKYSGQLNSSVAAIQNSADGGFGGAITAALFLEKFVGSIPWAHLDIYSWNDKVSGSFGFVGGNGQGVQALIGFIEQAEKNLDITF